MFGLEVSRLARSNADLARLLELARLTATLVIDNDGVYDLSDINDRLLLGLKSQMSEAELHWLTSRMNEAKRAAARRGELRVPLPVGLVYDDEDNVVIDPDEEVAAAISDVFAAFTATGSAYGVAGAFAGRRFPRRAYGGVVGRAAAVGPAHPRPRRRDLAQPGLRGGVRVRAAPLPPGRRPGRVSALLGHRTAPRPVGSADPRPPRRLHHLGGLPGQRGEAGRQPDQRRGPPAPGGHRAVPGDRVLRRLRPLHAGPLPGPLPPLRMLPLPRQPRRHAAMRVGPRRHHRSGRRRRAAGRGRARRRSRWRWPPPGRSPPGGSRSVRAAELAVERARYDADRAERAFLACEPENRLVARTLEARWETRLTDLAERRGGAGRPALRPARAARP